MKYLNVGCGNSYHKDWVNIDIKSSSPLVREFDIRKGLPYESNHFEAVYASHVLEHMTLQEAENLISEMRRVLKENGIIRIVVPDLEQIIREYMKWLDLLDESEEKIYQENYDWIMLELYDQTVRDQPGGNMLQYLLRKDLINKDYIIQRIGQEAQNFWNRPPKKTSNIKAKSSNYLKKIKLILIKKLILISLGRENVKSFEEGMFRNSGEIHRWMYDKYSLGKLLKKTGFSVIYQCSEKESRIKNFNLYNLDMDNNKPRKPDSLYMEAKK